MPRGKKDPKERRGYVINVYLTEDEFTEISEYCADVGVPASQFLRRAGLAHARAEEES